jgi:membrane protease subunit HflK
LTTQEPGSPPPPAAPQQAFGGELLRWAGHYWQLLGLQGKGMRLCASLAAAIWLLSGIYNVQPDEQGLVLRFGAWVDSTSSGLHYHLPWPFESVLLPHVTQINQLQLGQEQLDGSSDDQITAKQMLTGDENIVEADCTVFWKIKNAGDFLFKVKAPQDALRVAAESALRDVIARTPIQAAMSNQRQQVADRTQALLQQWLDDEHSGILITQVQLQRVDPPAAVIDAFNDVQRARADQERARNEAQAYSNDIVPKAHGEADRIEQDALAYQSQVVDLAQGEAKRFDALYDTYVKSRDVTAWRMYLEGMDELLKGAGKVVVIDSTTRGVGSVMPYMNLPDAAGAKPAAKETH